VPEAVPVPERSVCRGEEVGSICEYGAEEAGSDAVAKEEVYTCSRGGEAFHERKNSLGQGESVPKVVRRGASGDEPVP